MTTTNVITNNVLERTFRIKYRERAGTCFTITVENEMYLITASHIAKEIRGYDVVQIYYNSEWLNLRVNLIGHSELVDISVLIANLSFSPDYPMPATTANLGIGQDVYYLGFPNDVVNIDNLSASGMELNRNFPLPIVKHAIFSGASLRHDNLFIDGYANQGFSGGPMVFMPHNSNRFHVAGVIVNYTPEIIPVYQTKLEAKNDGSGKPPIGYFRGNSGTITVANIKHAVDLIKNNRE